MPIAGAGRALRHGLSRLAAAGGRLLQPGDAQAEPLEAGAAAALLLPHGVGRPPAGSDRPSRPTARLECAERDHAAADSRTIPFPSYDATQPLLGCHGCSGGVGGVVVTAGDRRVVRFSQPGLPAGDRELAGRRFSKRMSSRWSPGQPSVFRSRWGITKAISESGIDSLVRLVGRRGLQRCAGRIRGFNVASGWGTPRRSAGIQSRAPTGSHDRPVRADRSNDKSTSATAHAMAADAQPLLRLWSTTDAAVRTGAYWKPLRNGGFHNASMEARNSYRANSDHLRKVLVSRHFSSGANGIRTRDLLLAKKPVRTGEVA